MTGSQRQQEVMRWLRADAGFAQLVTVNQAGWPVARTVGALINEDWSVDLVQRRVQFRLDQMRQNPHLEIVWVGTPAPGSRNDHPTVFDYGRRVPRVMFLRGLAEFMGEEWTVMRYHQQSATLRAQGFTRAPDRSAENVREELVGVHVRPVKMRVEGFGDGAQSFAWTIEELT